MHCADIVLIPQDSQHLLIVKRKETLSQVTHAHTHLVFFSPSLPAVIFTGQWVNKAAVIFLWEPPVTGGLTAINFRTGRGDSCKEKARRIRNGLGHHLPPPHTIMTTASATTSSPKDKEKTTMRGTNDCARLSVEVVSDEV